MGRLDGKVCVITGAGGGMGRDAAQLFTQEGAKVCAADVDSNAAAETVAAVKKAPPSRSRSTSPTRRASPQ